jgi:hypothetical protein
MHEGAKELSNEQTDIPENIFETLSDFFDHNPNVTWAGCGIDTGIVHRAGHPAHLPTVEEKHAWEILYEEKIYVADRSLQEILPEADSPL